MNQGPGHLPPTRNRSLGNSPVSPPPKDTAVTPSAVISRLQSWKSNGVLVKAKGVSTPTTGGVWGERADGTSNAWTLRYRMASPQRWLAA